MHHARLPLNYTSLSLATPIQFFTAEAKVLVIGFPSVWRWGKAAARSKLVSRSRQSLTPIHQQVWSNSDCSFPIMTRSIAILQ